jgi:Leucine-rich repeat (LRR) protein
MEEGYEKARFLIREALEQNDDILFLDGLELTDIPPEITELAALRHLNLEHNDFETLPEILRDMPQLTSFYMDYNPIKMLPDWIGELTQMEGMNFYEGQLRELPDSFGELVNLDHLGLDFNLLRALPDSFGNLDKLESVGLVGNLLETLPETIGGLISLDSIDLHMNQLHELPASITELVKVEGLTLAENQFTHLPPGLNRMTSLKLINLTNNPITSLPDDLPELDYLDLVHCDRISALPATLKVTTALRLGGQKLTSIPVGCKNATLTWHGAIVEARIILHPETITAADILAARDHFAREPLLNLMTPDQVAREIPLHKLDALKRKGNTLTLVKIDIPDGEAEIYLMTVGRHGKNHRFQWVWEKYQTCQEAYDWLNRKWE